MFYNIFIKLQFIQIKHGYSHNDLLNFKSFFTQKLLDFNSTVIDSTYMTESNGCITLEISIENNIHSSETIQDILQSSLSQNINGLEIDINSEYKTFFISEDNLLNFNNKQHKPLFDIKDIPKNINSIVVNSKMALSKDDQPTFFFSFLDNQDNEVDYQPKWISVANTIYPQFFEADQAMDIKLGTVKRMLLGDDYQKTLQNSHFKIITEFMDNFDFLEKNKIEDNVILISDFF